MSVGRCIHGATGVCADFFGGFRLRKVGGDALSRGDAEDAWLSGEDIFADVRRDPTDTAAHPDVALVYRHAFAVPHHLS